MDRLIRREDLTAILPDAVRATVTRLRSRHGNTVLRVVQDDTRSWIVKLDTETTSSRRHKLQTEVWAATLAAKVGVPTARYTLTGTTSGGVAYAVYEFVPGTHLRLTFPNRRSGTLVESLGQQVGLLNRVRLQGFGWPEPVTSRGSHADWPMFMRDWAGEGLQRLMASGMVPARELRFISEVIEADVSLYALATGRLVHRDLQPKNVLVHSGRIVGILDWENAIIGDPVIDLAIFRLSRSCARWTKHIMDGYSSNWDTLMERRLVFYSIACGAIQVAYRVKNHRPAKQLWARVLALARKYERSS